MKDVPEIAPEIRGLLEEIVADPRSAIRLAPRRALLTWFDTGETARASDVARTKAERHLVEVHREELAALFWEASRISYWKAPVLSYRPVGADGKPFDPSDHELVWRSRAEREAGDIGPSSAVRLLQQCIVGIEPQQGGALARASLSLVPSDRARCYVALNAQWKSPRRAIALFKRLVGRAQPASLKPSILVSLAAQMCYLGDLAGARRAYRASGVLDPQSPYSWGCAFNLSCILGDERAAREEGTELGHIVGPGDPRLLEMRDLLRGWVETRSMGEQEKARSVMNHVDDKISEGARVLCQAFAI